METLRVIQIVLLLIAVIGTGAQAYLSGPPGRAGWAGLCAYMLSVLFGVIVSS